MKKTIISILIMTVASFVTALLIIYLFGNYQGKENIKTINEKPYNDTIILNENRINNQDTNIIPTQFDIESNSELNKNSIIYEEELIKQIMNIEKYLNKDSTISINILNYYNNKLKLLKDTSSISKELKQLIEVTLIKIEKKQLEVKN